MSNYQRQHDKNFNDYIAAIELRLAQGYRQKACRACSGGRIIKACDICSGRGWVWEAPEKWES